MDDRAVPTDPFVEFAQTRLTELSDARAVVSQPAAEFLDNHVGVRHASALFTAGHEASRSLVQSRFVGAELVHSEVRYTNVGFGTVTSEAELVGELETRVTGRDEAGKTVFTVDESWSLAEAARP